MTSRIEQATATGASIGIMAAMASAKINKPSPTGRVNYKKMTENARAIAEAFLGESLPESKEAVDFYVQQMREHVFSHETTYADLVAAVESKCQEADFDKRVSSEVRKVKQSPDILSMREMDKMADQICNRVDSWKESEYEHRRMFMSLEKPTYKNACKEARKRLIERGMVLADGTWNPKYRPELTEEQKAEDEARERARKAEAALIAGFEGLTKPKKVKKATKGASGTEKAAKKSSNVIDADVVAKAKAIENAAAEAISAATAAKQIDDKLAAVVEKVAGDHDGIKKDANKPKQTSDKAATNSVSAKTAFNDMTDKDVVDSSDKFVAVDESVEKRNKPTQRKANKKSEEKIESDAAEAFDETIDAEEEEDSQPTLSEMLTVGFEEQETVLINLDSIRAKLNTDEDEYADDFEKVSNKKAASKPDNSNDEQVSDNDVAIKKDVIKQKAKTAKKADSAPSAGAEKPAKKNQEKSNNSKKKPANKAKSTAKKTNPKKVDSASKSNSGIEMEPENIVEEVISTASVLDVPIEEVKEVIEEMSAVAEMDAEDCASFTDVFMPVENDKASGSAKRKTDDDIVITEDSIIEEENIDEPDDMMFGAETVAFDPVSSKDEELDPTDLMAEEARKRREAINAWLSDSDDDE